MAAEPNRHADLARLKREVRHQLLDLLMLACGLVMAVLADRDGDHRTAFLLLAVTYWGCPWTDRRDR